MLQHTETPLACATDPETWFAVTKAEKQFAIDQCKKCPMVLQCLDQCLELESMLGHTVEGIHAGTTPEQRRRLVGKFKRIA